MCLWLEEPCFSLVSYAMLHHILQSCIKQVSCFHFTCKPFFYHLFPESFIYSTATFSRLESKVDTCCLLPCILNDTVFLQRDNKEPRILPQTFWFSLYINVFSNNLCLSTTCCQEPSDVPDDYSLAKISVHLLQSSVYN